MRPVSRIPIICKLIEKLWKKYPDQRLGQLLENYVFGHRESCFFQDDMETTIRLKEEING